MEITVGFKGSGLQNNSHGRQVKRNENKNSNTLQAWESMRKIDFSN
jgi:hypothetical protein